MDQIKSGGVYLVDLGQNVGSEQSGIRPCVVMSNNFFIAISPFVHVIPLTKQSKKDIPTHVFISKDHGLKYDSTALCEQMTIVPKESVGRFLTLLDSGIKKKLRVGLLINSGGLPASARFQDVDLDHVNVKEIYKESGRTQDELKEELTELNTYLNNYLTNDEPDYLYWGKGEVLEIDKIINVERYENEEWMKTDIGDLQVGDMIKLQVIDGVANETENERKYVILPEQLDKAKKRVIVVGTKDDFDHSHPGWKNNVT